MSLQVWLPLTKDARNQGLSEVTYIGTPVFKSSGKLNNISLDLNTRISFNCPAIADLTTFSIAFWAKVNADSSITTDWTDIIGFNDISTSGTAGQLRWETCYGSANSSRGISSHNNATYAISNSFGNFMASGKGVWHHISCVVDLNNSVIKEYLNGEVQKTYTSLNGGHLNGTFWLGQTNQINGEIQDVRIYDHALSPLEVKHIAQGLILHYPLNRGGFGNENIIAGTKPTEQTYIYPSSSYQDKFAPITTVVPSEDKYTLSFYAKSTVAGDKIRAHYYSPNTTTTCVSSQGITRTASDGNMDFTLSTEWELYWVTYTQTETTAVKHVILPRMGAVGNTYGIVSGTGTVSIKCLKLEAGDKPTPWCPNSSDALATTMNLNSTIEYDTSGFHNNGTRTGTFSWTSDTPRYQISTYFADGSTSYITASVFMPTDKITTSVWFKGDGSTSGANSYHIPFCLGSGTAEFSVDSAKLYRQGYYINGTRYCDTISGAIVNDGRWHMMTATYDGTILCRYLDGQLINSKSISGTLNGGMLTLLIGKYYQGGYNNRKVKQSDVRIYATALSAEDIQNLYNLGASIDSNGTLNTYQYVES